MKKYFLLLLSIYSFCGAGQERLVVKGRVLFVGNVPFQRAILETKKDRYLLLNYAPVHEQCRRRACVFSIRVIEASPEPGFIASAKIIDFE